MEYIRRHLTVAATVTDNFNDGLNPSVFDSACHNDRRMYRRISSIGISNTHRQLYRRYVSVGMSHYHGRDKSVCIFQAGNFFFCAQFLSVKPSANVFFILPIDIATDGGITDERKADGRIPSVRTSINKLPTNS
jgi:hypothetical protein